MGRRLTVHELAAAIAAATGEVDDERRRIAVALYDLLAQGEPGGGDRVGGKSWSRPAGHPANRGRIQVGLRAWREFQPSGSTPPGASPAHPARSPAPPAGGRT